MATYKDIDFEHGYHAKVDVYELDNGICISIDQEEITLNPSSARNMAKELINIANKIDFDKLRECSNTLKSMIDNPDNTSSDILEYMQKNKPPV